MYRARLYTIVCLSVLSLLLTLGNIWHTMPALLSVKPTQKFYWDDYPEFYIPTKGDLPQVAMTMEESRHYGISDADALEEWASNSADGFGYLRLGEEYRTFALAMFHEMHCLRNLRYSIAESNNMGHVLHCLNYLRQFILCSPNLTLEPPDVLTRDFEMERVGATHVCPNWVVIYDELTDNWRKWHRVQNQTTADAIPKRSQPGDWKQR
ncbi:hypothetical protein C8J57DRAFT_1228606 [Mycena rebaudengoi]|nr:hypothetical protein C8J57DRAFT_1228606 [Mycena rebaudengoi]